MGSCAACRKPLVLEIRIEDDQENQPIGSTSNHSTTQTIPDDVELQCACHFHWQCLLDGYQISNCPACTRPINTISSSGHEQVICNLHNEGGMQPSLDILPILAEESYLKAYPEERKCRAFLEFCREGDVEAIVDLLNAIDDSESEDDDDEGNDSVKTEEPTESYIPLAAADILRYQDPIGSMYSALHIAVISEKLETVWLLLLLASTLEHIPPEVVDAAEALGISRGDQTGKRDIRTLVDTDGRTAIQYAQLGSISHTFDLRNLIPPSS
ncbi:hypothetical protein MMC14_008127 [Varicellaria rhodocarpa]|nr:hypothetical protein [Varicellaria rhodocarpa]